MARPYIGAEKKQTLSLTISKETKEKLDVIRRARNMSISEFVEDCIIKEYQRIQMEQR